MATNDTGYEITVGPDRDGRHFTVPPGGDYETPIAPSSALAERDDVGAALATFGDNNIRGQVAATDLRMAISTGGDGAPDWAALMHDAAAGAKEPQADQDAPDSHEESHSDPDTAGDSQEEADPS